MARRGHARVSLPGGCAIGVRPIDQHLAGLTALGATVTLEHGYVDVRAAHLVGTRFRFAMPTVTGTENLLMAAVLARGETVLENCAREPEVADLARLLVAMGAEIEGAGSETIRLRGVAALRGATHRVIPDRIEAGTYLVAAAITGGEVTLEGGVAADLEPLLDLLRGCGRGGRGRRHGRDHGGARRARVKPRDVVTAPFPGFPTDLQAQCMALATQAQGHDDDLRDRLREPLPARRRAGAHGRRHPPRRPLRARARHDGALRRHRHGDRPARLRLPRARRPRRRGRDDRRPDLPSRSRLRGDGGEAQCAGRERRAA